MPRVIWIEFKTQLREFEKERQRQREKEMLKDDSFCDLSYFFPKCKYVNVHGCKRTHLNLHVNLRVHAHVHVNVRMKTQSCKRKYANATM